MVAEFSSWMGAGELSFSVYVSSVYGFDLFETSD
jgi:hypothetical protein